jgi:hypothetical protein
MWLTLDDLRCAQCRAYVHPLVETCPACAAAHQSLVQEAALGPVGAVRLVEAPETQNVARSLAIRYTMKVNAIGNSSASATMVDAVAYLADALPYRIAGDALPVAENATLALGDRGLIAKARPSGAILAEIPLHAIVGVAARRGEVTVYFAPDLLSGPAAKPNPFGARSLTVGNRRGLLASKARADHFQDLATWLGVLAAAAAERRWIEIGLPAYLVELGPAAGGAGRALGTADKARPAVDSPGSAAGLSASQASVQASLVELESLRAAGLLADNEYVEKRREILARL